MEITELKETDIEIACVIIQIAQLKLKILITLNNILIDKKIYKNILVYDISYKVLFGSRPLRIRFGEGVDLLDFMMGLRV